METDSNNTHRQLLGQLEDSRVRFVQAGKLLYNLKQDDNWRTAVGDGLESWQSYLAQPEIGLTVGEAGRLMSIYEVFVLKHGYREDVLADVPMKNLHYLLPLAKGDADIDELFADAQHLSQRDFRERIHDVKSNDDGIRTYEYVIMRKCKETGGMRKVHGITSEAVEAIVNELIPDAE